LSISKGAWAVIILLAIIIIIVATGVSKYNSLARMDVAVDQKWAEVDNQLKRRSDLIPNLVETVKGYASHEKELFENIAEARAKLAGATTVGEAAGATGQLNGFLGRLLAIAENYPELKANENFLKLQDALEGTENRIAVARTRYNEAVRTFNTAIRVFPSNIIAGFVGYEKKEFFEVPEADKELPEVKFD